MRLRSNSALTLLEIIVVVFVAIAIVAVLVPGTTRCGSRTLMCASNLRSLWQSQFNYAAQYGRPHGDLPEEMGIDFWLKLQRTPKPLIDRYEPFICPLSGEEPGPGRCSYRGPAFPIRTLANEDPLAADKEGNHGPGAGGSIMTKMGDILVAEATDPLWIRARVTTKD